MAHEFKSRLDGSIRSIRRLLTRQPDAAPRPAARTRSPAAEARAEDRLRVRLMRDDLYQLLEQHADSRRLMRHLGLVERILRKKGWDAVDSLPTKVIAKALVQLESLVRDWSPDGLAEVRSRMAVLVKNRPADAPAQGDTGDDRDDGIDQLALLELGLVTFDNADIDEAHHAAFEEMERSWAGRMPAVENGNEA